MRKSFIIAEVGVNHNANLEIANQLIDEAVAAGADAIKFQTAIPELVATSFAQKAAYQKLTSSVDESQLEMIGKIHFPLEVYSVLKAACETQGIMFFSTAFDITSLAFLQNLGQDLHKVPSGEITNLPYRFLRKAHTPFYWYGNAWRDRGCDRCTGGCRHAAC